MNRYVSNLLANILDGGATTHDLQPRLAFWGTLANNYVMPSTIAAAHHDCALCHATDAQVYTRLPCPSGHYLCNRCATPYFNAMGGSGDFNNTCPLDHYILYSLPPTSNALAVANQISWMDRAQSLRDRVSRLVGGPHHIVFTDFVNVNPNGIDSILSMLDHLVLLRPYIFRNTGDQRFDIYDPFMMPRYLNEVVNDRPHPNFLSLLHRRDPTNALLLTRQILQAQNATPAGAHTRTPDQDVELTLLQERVTHCMLPSSIYRIYLNAYNLQGDWWDTDEQLQIRKMLLDAVTGFIRKDGAFP